MIPRVKRHHFTFPKAVAGACLVLYGLLTFYADYGLQPKAAYILAGRAYADDNALIVPEHIESIHFSASWNGFRARICQPVFSSPEQEGFPPAAITLPGCATLLIPYIGKTITFTAPDAEAQIVYNGLHRVVTRSELRGEMVFRRTRDARSRIRGLMLGVMPLSVGVWSEHMRFYSERPGKPHAYAAAEHLSVMWEGAEGNSAVALPGSRILVSLKHIIAGAEEGADDDRQLFPISFTGEFRMNADDDKPSEDVLIDSAKLFFRDFAIVAYGKAAPAGETHMYPTADFVVEIDNYEEAMRSSLPVRLLLPKSPESYTRGSLMAERILGALAQEQESDGRLRRFDVKKNPGEPLTVGGKSVEHIIELYGKALSSTK